MTPHEAMVSQCPQEAGIYWAKSTENHKWWDVIVEIRGTKPYLHWKAIHYSRDEGVIETGVGPPYRFVFGPKIERDDELAARAKYPPVKL